MIMKTNDFIRILAADNSHTWSTRNLLAVTLLATFPLSFMIFIAELGMRKDIATAIHNPFFDLKFVVTVTLALSAGVISLHLSRPEAFLKDWGWLLTVPLGFLSLGIVADMMMLQPVTWTARLVGTNSWLCLTAIPVLSLPLLMGTLLALRHGAPANPAMTGAFAGLLSAGLAATLYASHCIDDSPLFVAVWYTLAIGLTATIGALAGSKVLKF
jgi:hypothetical protein